jgi:ribosomal protein S12 methylthiotransferase
MRGKHRSKSIEHLVKEASHFARQGVKELILIAQELTYYGLDLYKRRALPDLLEALAAVEGIEWIRLHYAYPSKFPIVVIHTMARHPSICNYLDMPLQHASDNVLAAMRRQITQAETRALIRSIREIIPGIAIRTTFLVGYPGETEADFEELCQFLQDMRFERVGVFQYSHEEDTYAYAAEDDVPPGVKAERAARIMEIQQEISLEKNRQLVGKAMRVIIDRKEGEYFVGRTEFDSPEVDNEVLIPAKDHFMRIGDFEQVRIMDVHEYDLFAEPIR